MLKYRRELIPESFGLANNGSLCYLNSLMQSIISCSAFNDTVLKNKEYMYMTNTGKALYDFVNASIHGDPPTNTSAVFRALITDVRTRKPHVRFSNGQQSASECLVLMLEMIEPPNYGAIELEPGTPSVDDDGAPAVGLHPITDIFLHCYQVETICHGCKGRMQKNDYGCQFNMFSFGADEKEIDFLTTICSEISEISDRECPKCEKRGEETTFQKTLMVIPDIIVCVFNIYESIGRVNRRIPKVIKFRAADDSMLVYSQVAQIEHSGSRSGGHYWARALRKNKVEYMLNDSSFSETRIMPTKNTYLVFYHLT